MHYPTTSSAARACYCSAVSPLERSPPRLNAVHEVGKDFRLTTIRSIRGAEPVADAGFGQRELRALGIGLDLLAELADIDAQILRVSELVPQLLQEEAVGQHLAGVLHQHAQEIVLLRRQFYFALADL